jgi:MoxR-like ATPase
MISDDPATHTDATTGHGPAAPPRPDGLALVLAWCADEPDRVGETLIVPAGDGAHWSIFGRGRGTTDDPYPRVELSRCRPGRITPAAPLTNQRLSRVQLRLQANRDSESIVVERLGRSPLFRNDEARPVERALLHPGDTLRIGHQYLLLTVRRPAWMPPIDGGSGADEFPFGLPDRFGLIGESPAIWALRAQISFVARQPDHVLVTGPSGTGKEMVARAIHSLTSSRPMVARNAATFPDTLIDAELFGTARNYPNVGMPERPGLIGEASGSSLFLDEFGELPRAMQAHLLRVLDIGEYQRLGDQRVRHSRFRLIAATNRPLSVFQEDVLARLTLRIDVSDLNTRREDIPLLTRHLMGDVLARQQPSRALEEDASFRISMPLMNALVRHRYTTNMRELRAMLLDALAEAHGAKLEPPPPARGPSPASGTAPRDAAPPAAGLRVLDPAQLQEALDRRSGNIELTWRDVGLSSRHALVRLVARHGLRAGRTWQPSEPS